MDDAYCFEKPMPGFPAQFDENSMEFYFLYELYKIFIETIEIEDEEAKSETDSEQKDADTNASPESTNSDPYYNSANRCPYPID